MNRYKELQDYIIETLSLTKIETIWQKSNKNEAQNDGLDDGSIDSSLVHDDHIENKPQNSPNDN